MKARKGQITVFIIIGLLILAGIVVYISVQKISEESPVIPETEEVSIEFQPIRTYVDQCLEQTAKDALKLVGDHGGYINPEDFEITANSAEPTSSNGAAFPGNWILPYWFYLESDNKCIKDCKFSSERPELKGANSIESQINSYIEEKIKDCTRNFEAFEKEGYVIEEVGDIKVTTTILESEVLFAMEYPIRAAKDDAVNDIKDFIVRIPVKLKEIYNLATTITNLEQQYRFLERHAIQLIVGFSGVDEEKLPPMSDVRWQFGETVSWRKTKVKKDVESALTSYVQLLRAAGTSNFDVYSFPGEELKEALYNIHMVIPMNESYESLAMRLDYNDIWPVYFELNCKGELCEPLSVSQSMIALIGIQRYEFAYDVSFPVLVEIYDPSAFNNQGYYFRFFLEANLRNNEVMWSDFWPLEPVDLVSGSMLCDVDKRNSGDIKVEVVNAKDNSKIDDANIVYSCADESCAIGLTSNGLLKEKFPVCIGGIISVIKENYLTKSQLFSTILDKEDSVKIALEPVREKKFVVKKKKLVKSGEDWIFRPNGVNIDLEEEALISLNRVSGLGEQDYSINAEYKLGQEQEIKIVPGTYEINIQLFSNNKLVIPEEEREAEGSEKYTMPEVKFDDVWLSGSLKLIYEFKKADLDNNDEIVFYVISPDLLSIPLNERKIEDLQLLGRFDQYSKAYADSLKPGFE